MFYVKKCLQATHAERGFPYYVHCGVHSLRFATLLIAATGDRMPSNLV